jgi:hypothetical protein
MQIRLQKAILVSNLLPQSNIAQEYHIPQTACALNTAKEQVYALFI